MIAAKFRIMTIEQRAVRGTAENFVICDTQKSYSENLFRRLSEKLSGYFQFHVFHDIENLKIAAKSMQVNILLIGDEYGKEDRDEIPARQKYLLIGEKIPNERSPTEIPFFRYQSVSSMLELLLQEKDQENSEVQTHQIQLVSDRSQTVKANVNGLIGIYSPVHRIGKTRFAMRMGRVLSESLQEHAPPLHHDEQPPGHLSSDSAANIYQGREQSTEENHGTAAHPMILTEMIYTKG